jgi:hypothetical protein
MISDKEMNRVYWIIKNRLMPSHWDQKTKLSYYNNFFKRCWYNEEGFEEVYKERKSSGE